MTIEKGKFVAPITVDEVNRFFNGISWDLADVCLLAAINKWSLHKPIEHPTHALLTEDQIYASNCGLSIPLELEYDPVTLQAPWTYNRPIGGDKSPYRLADFNGYHHTAEPPVRLQITTTDGQLDGYGNIKMRPKITAVVVLNPDADIDITRMNYLDPAVTGIYLRVVRDGKVFEYGVADTGDLDYPFVDLVNNAVYEVTMPDATYDVTTALIKTNGNILGVDPDFGDNQLIGYKPYYSTAAERLGLSVTLDAYATRGAKNRLYIKAVITSSLSESTSAKIKIFGEWYLSNKPNDITYDNYTEEVVTVPGGTTLEWVPDGLLIDEQGYGEIIDESGLDTSSVVYKYNIKVTVVNIGDFVADIKTV